MPAHLIKLLFRSGPFALFMLKRVLNIVILVIVKWTSMHMMLFSFSSSCGLFTFKVALKESLYLYCAWSGNRDSLASPDICHCRKGPVRLIKCDHL